VRAWRSGPAFLLALVVAGPAAGQVQAVDPGAPLGLPQPVTGVAAAEEATALSVNPAGPGLVAAPALHYLHAGAIDGPTARGDGLYAAGLLGHLGPALGLEWVDPPAGPRYRLTTLGLSVGDGQVLSLGVAWRWYASTDPALNRLTAWDLGVTLRPTRHLSLALSTLGRDARLGGERLPVRYDLGAALRLAGDSLTLAADLLGDDRARDDVQVDDAALGLQWASPYGVTLSGQVRLPLRDRTDRGVSALVAIAWEAPHAGWTTGATTRPHASGWLTGVRLSAEPYRADPAPILAPRLDLARLLEQEHFLIFRIGERDPYGALLRRLEAARTDPEVAAVVLQIDDLPLGSGRIEELRDRVKALAAAKPVLAWLSGGGTRGYWLASAATRVAVPPSSTLLLNGLARSQLYFRDGLARLGVTVEVARAGAYKSATEPLTRTGPSDAAREMSESLLDDLSERMIDDIGIARRMTQPEVRKLIDRGAFTAREAVSARLVDELLWPDELAAWSRREGRHGLVPVEGWKPATRREAERWGPRAAIAVVRLEGTITTGKSRRDGLGAAQLAGVETVARALRAAAHEDRVKAIVLRIDSPGGDAQASDLLWREVRSAHEKKPVVVSMGDYAASGGYLVAMGADYLVAQPSTLTGSIGVFALKPDLSGLLQKLSITRDASARGALADGASLAKAWTPEERAAVERSVDAIYESFLDRVCDGRKLPRDEVKALAGGRVWTGAQAARRKLVDRLGGLEEALEEARKRAGLDADDAPEVLPVDLDEGALSLDGPLAAAVRLAPSLVEPVRPEGLAARLALLLPEVRTAAVLVELGPMLMLPMDWLPDWRPPAP
jgi:protease IV